MFDSQLHAQRYLPAAGANNIVGPIDLHVDGDQYGNAWRKGRIRVTIPAMPNHVTAGDVITLAMQQQPEGGGAYANTVPLIEVQIPGVASTGSAAVTVDCPLPPLLTGPIQFVQTVPGGDGNNTGALIQYDWVNE
jgi:hypothetical protein